MKIMRAVAPYTLLPWKACAVVAPGTANPKSHVDLEGKPDVKEGRMLRTAWAAAARRLQSQGLCAEGSERRYLREIQANGRSVEELETEN
jgi:hypothetical protein